LTLRARSGDQIAAEQNENVPMRHPWTFRQHLVFSLGLAISRSRLLLRRLREHVSDQTRHELAERVISHLEQSGSDCAGHAAHALQAAGVAIPTAVTTLGPTPDLDPPPEHPAAVARNV
jgi:hypothetical protein